MAESAQERIIVALDVPTVEEATRLVKELKPYVGMFKVGLELVVSTGLEIIKHVIDLGADVFLDCKFHDIPNTVAAASRAASRLQVSMFNVHAMGGSAMMKAAKLAAGEEAAAEGIACPIVLAVSMLTSIDEQAMNEQLRIGGAVEAQVAHLSKLAYEAGMDGMIASPLEIKAIRRAVGEEMLIVTPGVRPKWASAQDQKRIMTPGEAILQGASSLVIGRPITKPPDEIGSPADAAMRIGEEIANALEAKGGTG